MEISKKTLRNIFLGVASCIVLYWLLHETDRVKSVFSVIKDVFAPFALGAALAFIFNVPMRFIEKNLDIERPKLRRGVAMLLTLILLLLILALVFGLLIPQLHATVTSLIDQFPAFLERSEEYLRALLEQFPQAKEWVVEYTDLENIDWSVFIQNIVTIASNSVSTIVSGAFSAIGTASTAIMNLVISFVFALYCLGCKEVLARQGRRLIYSFLPEHFCDETVRILRLTNSTFSNFISGQCLEAVILGAMFAVSMAIFRMPYVALVSVIISVTALVPLVGAFVGCFLGAFFILVDNPMQAVAFVAMFLILQQIEGNLIYPKVVGTSIGLPGMWVLAAVAVGGELMGIAGMFLMVPVASVLYTLMREITNTRLEERGIDRTKLQDHPPELKSKFKENREKRREKRKLKQAEKMAQNEMEVTATTEAPIPEETSQDEVTE